MEKRSPKAHCPHLLPGNGIHAPRGKSGEGLAGSDAQKEGEKGKQGPVVPRSSQVNVLQTEQQSEGRLGGFGGEGTGDHKRNSQPRDSPPPVQVLAESGSGDKNSDVWEGQSPRQKEQ